MKVTTLGIDLAKSTFRVHGVDGRGTVVLRRQLTRKQLLPFLARLSPCLVDDFRIIAYIFFVLTPVALFMRKPAARSSAPAGH
jgi:transposase